MTGGLTNPHRQDNIHDQDIEALHAAIAALEGQRGALGDTVLDLATAPLRARLAGLLRPVTLQRRQVTVLFADVVGSTAMAGAMNAEDTLDLLSDALRGMASLVEAHQGRVLRFTGDGVKAAFGMDGAREDDPDRAVRAGLAILQAGREQAAAARLAHGIADFAVRVGVHTGDVAVGAGVEADNTAMGAAVNIAARMEQSAPPGALRISHETWNQVRGLFDVEHQPPLRVKGVDAPIQTYLVRAALDRGFAGVERGLQGLSTPMVGRQAELQRLLDAVARTRQTRHAQALTLVGDAGLGKSRLLRELMAALTADPSGHRLLTVRAQPDGALRPWGLLRSLLAAEFGVADNDSADTARRKVVEGLSPWFNQRGERQAQLIGQLSGLDFSDSPQVRGLDPRSLRDQALAALMAYLQALAANSAALPVLIVEDLHWADNSSLDLLQHLQAHAAELPLALVMTARPPLLTRRPDWVSTDARDSLVPLSPLTAAHSEALARALLQRMGDVPARLTELIIGQAEGNPYYMEELVRRLVDDGVIDTGGPQWTVQLARLDTLRLPTTLIGLLQARLDALPTADRKAARQASVIGHIFWDDALQALDPNALQALPALQRAAFVKARDTSDFEGTAERQFDHHLLHQVTYDTLLIAERKRGHGAAARWLTERTQGRGAEFLAMTGEHAERAGETALAIDCFEQAGMAAQTRFANAIAQIYCRRALALLGEADPARSIDLLTRVEQIADTVDDRITQDATQRDMAAILERHPDDACQARLWFSMALLADRRGDSTTSERLSRQACELAERCGAAQWAAMAHGQLAWLHIARQDYAGASRHIALGLPWAGGIEAQHLQLESEAQLLTLSGMNSMQLSRMDEARSTLTAVLSRGEALGKPRLQLGALNNLSIVAGYLGRWEEAAAWGERMRALAHAIGAPNGVAGGQFRLAVAAAAWGDAAAATRWHEQNLVIYRAIGSRRMQAITLRVVGGLRLEQGAAEAALQCCAQALTLHQALAEPLEACAVAAIAALCAIRLGQPAEGLAGLNATLDRLQHELAEHAAEQTMQLRWHCHQALVALGDERAEPLLEQLHADVQARATEMTAAADRERLIQAIPTFRDIEAAHGQRGAAAAAAT
ncbi:MAG: AAA family ATPase [Microbacteriaceae bacterium]|nr:AAA family ATPase [Burkholderiaceae bacterium]